MLLLLVEERGVRCIHHEFLAFDRVCAGDTYLACELMALPFGALVLLESQYAGVRQDSSVRTCDILRLFTIDNFAIGAIGLART